MDRIKYSVVELQRAAAARFSMPRWFSLVSFASALVCAAAARPGVVVFRNESENYHTFRIPNLAVLPPAASPLGGPRLLACVEARARLGFVPPTGDTADCYGEGASLEDWKCTNKDIACKLSADGGATWGPLAVLAEANTTHFYTNPQVLVDVSRGSAFIEYMRCVSPTDGGSSFLNCTSVLRKSGDGGQSWGPPRDVPPEQYSSGGFGGIVTYSGRLVFSPPSGKNTGVLYSDDAGETFSWGQPLPLYGESEVAEVRRLSGLRSRLDARTVPPVHCQVSPGVLVLTVRQKNNTRILYSSVDGGTTWGPPQHQVVTDPNCEASMIALDDGSAGTRRLLFANPHTSGFMPQPYGRLNVSVQASDDAGASWAPVLLVDPGPSAYTSLAQLSPGLCGLLWEWSDDYPVDFFAISFLAFNCSGARGAEHETSAVRQPHPRAHTPESSPPPATTFFNATLLAYSKRLANSSDPRVKPAVEALLASAEKALRTPPQSVTQQYNASLYPFQVDPRDYVAIEYYCWPCFMTPPHQQPRNITDCDAASGVPWQYWDGEVSPFTSLYDLDIWDETADALQTLSLAFYFSDNETYAAHAAALARTWFIDETTGMLPNLDHGHFYPYKNSGEGAGIIDFSQYFATGFLDCLVLLRASAAWTPGDDAAMRAWGAQFLEWLLESPIAAQEASSKNNHKAYYEGTVLQLAAFLGNVSVAASRAPTERGVLDYQIAPDGMLWEEVVRTRSCHYVSFCMHAFLGLASGCSAGSVDLYAYVTKNGTSIAGAAAWVAPYADGLPWPYENLDGPKFSWSEFYDVFIALAYAYPARADFFAQAAATTVNATAPSDVRRLLWPWPAPSQ